MIPILGEDSRPERSILALMADEPRFLLVSTRLDDFMQNHELKCLLRAGELEPSDFRLLNVTREPLNKELYDQYEAVFIGGTGDFSVAQDRPDWYRPLSDWTKGLLEHNVPSLGLCYGFHLMAEAVGGEVQTRPVSYTHLTLPTTPYV